MNNKHDNDKRTGWQRELLVGDKVIVSARNNHFYEGTITKVTPTGRIVVRAGKTETTFDPHGRHHITKWESAHITSPQEAERAVQMLGHCRRKAALRRIIKEINDATLNDDLNEIETLFNRLNGNKTKQQVEENYE